MRIAVSGWFAGRSVGSGQYTDQLVAALRAGAAGDDAIEVVAPPRHGVVDKLAFEQWGFPRATRRFDVAHVPYWAPPQWPMVPTVVTVHDLIPLVLPDYRARLDVRAYTALVARASCRAAAVIADSEHTAADIRARLDVDPARVHVVPLGVEARYRPDLPGRDVVATCFGLPARFGLYLGGFDVRKNLETLLAAWRDVYRATGVPLALAGTPPAMDDPFLPHPAAIARRIGLPPGAVRVLGFVDEAVKPLLLSGAAVFVFPSRYEGFGLPPLEAMACGVPVVASSTTSVPEVVGAAGQLVDPGDVAGWAEAIRAVIEDADAAARFRAAGLARAARFTWARTAGATRAVYRAADGDGSEGRSNVSDDRSNGEGR